MNRLIPHVRTLRQKRNELVPGDGLRDALDAVLDRLMPIGETEEQAAHHLQRIELQRRLDTQLLDAAGVFNTLVHTANTDWNASPVRDQVKADPALAFTELVALALSTVGYHLSRSRDDALKELLFAAGIQPRPARPAAIVLQCDTPHVKPVYLTNAKLPPSSDAVTIAKEDRYLFHPLWEGKLWTLSERKSNGDHFIWDITFELKADELAQPIELIAFLSEFPDEVDALELPWSLSIKDHKHAGILAKSIVDAACLRTKQPELLEPHQCWLAFAHSTGKDDAVYRSLCRWVCFSIRLPVTVKAGKVTATLSLNKQLPEKVQLHSNCAVWLNGKPRVDHTLAIDRQGLWTLPDSHHAGDQLNGATETKWEGPIKAFHGAINGGMPNENDADFLMRASSALRYRGSPTTAADWEYFLPDCDPLDRIAAVAAHGTLLPLDTSSAVGVDVLMVCAGHPWHAHRLAAWMRDEWITAMAAAVRPLACAVSLYIPQPLSITFSCKRANPEMRWRQAREALMTATQTRIERRGFLTPFWEKLLDQFRQHGAWRTSQNEVIPFLQEYLHPTLEQFDLEWKDFAITTETKHTNALHISLIPICSFELQGENTR